MQLDLSPLHQKQLRDLAEAAGKPEDVLATELLAEALSDKRVPANRKLSATKAVRPERRLSNLRGLGKGIRQGENAQEYVNRLREEEWR